MRSKAHLNEKHPYTYKMVNRG